MNNNSHSENITSELRKVTDLLSSYQQKITIYNDEIMTLKQLLANKDKDIESMRLQLKNLKRSRSQDKSYDKRQNMTYINSNQSGGDSSTEIIVCNVSNLTQSIEGDSADKKVRTSAMDSSETFARQAEIANDEIKLFKNKISRLEDDLLYVTQVSPIDKLSSQ